MRHLATAIVLSFATLALGRVVVPRVPRYEVPWMAPERIIGGNITTQGQFPFMVSLQHRSLFGASHTCGATILNDNHVLTAAHCVKGYSQTSFDVVAAEQNLDDSTGLEETLRSEKIFIHDFSWGTGANDIAIIRLSHNFVFVHDLVERVPLPDNYQEPLGTTCTAVGWGYTQDAGAVSPDLRHVELPVLSDKDCKAIYGEDAIFLDMMCAGYLGGDAAVCNGDSGGPLICDGVQMGIVSFSSDEGCTVLPAVFTQVSHFIDWINLNIEA